MSKCVFSRISYGEIGFMLLALSCLFACQKADEARILQASFYHWQTKVDLTTIETQYLENLNVQKIYCKFFDVDWKDGAFPSANIEWASDMSAYEIVPTVFITNRTLLEIETADLPDLAKKIATKINQLAPAQGFQELQFDCDWSGKSQQKYFDLLKLLRQHFPEKQLSVTIRLHQIKFFERTGVPAVDRAMLMCYNVGKIGEWQTENSILDTTVLSQYLFNFDRYPLHLDVALPIFHWGLLFRDGHLSRILNNLEEEDLRDTTRFKEINLKSQSTSSILRFEVIKSTYLDGHYLYEGDKIRLEGIASKELHRTAELLAAVLPKRNLNVAFYHLDTTTIQQHPYENLDTILQLLE